MWDNVYKLKVKTMNEIHYCSYGCGNIATFQQRNKKWCCKKNPSACPAIIEKAVKTFKNSIKTGKYIPSWTGKHHTDEQKKHVSDMMKKAHAEGRAHNIGESRWNNEPSYPEQWFMTVIKNHFSDQKYIREFPFFRFSLDFAWQHKKKCIEIDGDQHQRFTDYAERDARKDAKLKEEGWQVLRLRWKDVQLNKQYYIKLAKDFIDC